MGIIEIIAWIVVVAQGLAILVLVRELADIKDFLGSHRRGIMKVLPVGTAAPTFEALDFTTRSVVSSEMWQGKAVRLLFVSATCALCRKLIAELAVAATLPKDLAVYCDGELDRHSERLALIAPRVTVLSMASRSVPTLFGVSEFPVAVTLDEGWRVAEIVVPASIEDLKTNLGASVERTLNAA